MALYVNGVKTNNVLAYSGGGEHEYSTTEQVVGKWIDGSTLYEKTLELNSVSMNTGWAVIGNIPNIAKLVSCNQQELVPSENNYGYTGLPAVYYYNSGDIALYNFLGGHMGSISGYVTVRYTKVSV